MGRFLPSAFNSEGHAMTDEREDHDEAEAWHENTVWARYFRAFPNDPVPLQAWHGGEPELLAAQMEKAIRTGEPLTANELLKVQRVVESDA
jgi:hypothetical protein